MLIQDDDNVLLFNKPYKWTSFDVVHKIRNTLKIKRIGHAGTLDPLATGLLIICTGKMTRSIHMFQDMEKEYTGTLVLGYVTASYDLETAVTGSFPTEQITPDLIRETASLFTGVIEQTPPAHSAVKVGGKRSYALARKGKTPELKSRKVHVNRFEITSIDMPRIQFLVTCSKGTYIRSLAHDFGKALGSGAYLEVLCRTRIGHYRLADAYEIEAFVSASGKAGTAGT